MAGRTPPPSLTASTAVSSSSMASSTSPHLTAQLGAGRRTDGAKVVLDLADGVADRAHAARRDVADADGAEGGDRVGQARRGLRTLRWPRPSTPVRCRWLPRSTRQRHRWPLCLRHPPWRGVSAASVVATAVSADSAIASVTPSPLVVVVTARHEQPAGGQANGGHSSGPSPRACRHRITSGDGAHSMPRAPDARALRTASRRHAGTRILRPRSGQRCPVRVRRIGATANSRRQTWSSRPSSCIRSIVSLREVTPSLR